MSSTTAVFAMSQARTVLSRTGFPVEELRIRPNGCLEAAFPWSPQYAVVEKAHPLTAPVVRISPSKRAILYRLDARASDHSCFARLRQH